MTAGGIPGRPGVPPDVSGYTGRHRAEEPDQVTDSDPNGNTPQGLAGGMGVSSERVGHLREGAGEGTHGAGVPHPGAPEPATDQQDPSEEEQPDLPPPAQPSSGAPNPLGPGPDHEPSDDWRG